MVRPEVGAMGLRSCNLVDEKEEVGEEKSIGNEIIVVTEAGLKRRESLLVVLQRIDILPGTAVRKTERRDSHDGIRKGREMSGFSLKEIRAQRHATALEPERVVLAPIMREQLLPDNVPEVSKQRRILAVLLNIRVQEGHIIFEFDGRRERGEDGIQGEGAKGIRNLGCR